ncbi:MAG: hypothetical protein V7606_5103 [Burkholderiales bacterium]
MAKTKQPAKKKSSGSAEDRDDVLAQKLCDLALDLIEREDYETLPDELKQKETDFRKIIRKSLHQKKDELLFEALQLTEDEDSDAYLLLKNSVEEASGVIVVRDDQAALEVNAFVIPIFARTTGGLDRAQIFQDEEAFDLLITSIKEAQLESGKAKVVLVSHAYHLDEIDRVRYSELNEMVHDAHASMTSKKMVATPAITRSISGWPESTFGPEDEALELRFLLGFALKAVDDPFYQVPKGEDAADAFFATRAERFQRWTGQAAPLVKRLLVTGGRDIDVNFLYQDLFHGGKERGIAELYMLQMMSELSYALQEQGIDPGHVKAVMGPAEIADGAVLRVSLYAEDGALLATSEKPMESVRDLDVEAADTYDALMTIGIRSLALADRFDGDGQAVGARKYEE